MQSASVQNEIETVEPIIAERALVVSNPLPAQYTKVFNSNPVNIFSYLTQNLLAGLKKNSKGKNRLSIRQVMKRTNQVIKYSIKSELVEPGWRDENNGQISLDGRSAQFLWFLIAKFAQELPPQPSLADINRSSVIIFRNSEIADIFKMTARNARNVIADSFITLKSVIWDFNEWSKEKNANVHYTFSPVETKIEVARFGYTGIRLNLEFAHYLAKTPLRVLPVSVLSLNPKRNPNSLPFAIKLISNWHINRGREQQNKISVTSMLEIAFEIPKYEDIVENHGRVKFRIMRPFFRDMDKLVETGIISCWYFQKPKQPQKISPDCENITYDEFKNYNIYYKLLIDESDDIDVVVKDGK